MEEDYKKYRCIHLADCRGNDKLCKAIQRVKELEEEKTQLRLTIRDNYISRGEYLKAKTIMTSKLRDYIPKSKIREKIEELDEKRKEYEEKSEGLLFNGFWYIEFLKACHKIQILNEILEDK